MQRPFSLARLSNADWCTPEKQDLWTFPRFNLLQIVPFDARIGLFSFLAMGRLEFHERRAPMMAQRHSAIALLALAFATKSQGQPETMTPTTLLESSNSTINRGMYMQAFVYLYGHGSCTNDLPTLQRRIRLGQCTNNTAMRTSMIVTTGETAEGFPLFDVQVPICSPQHPPRPPQLRVTPPPFIQPHPARTRSYALYCTGFKQQASVRPCC